MSTNYLKRNCKLGKIFRITISLDKDLEEKIKSLQEQILSCVGEEWSMSKVINMILLGGMLSKDKLSIYDWDRIKEFTEGKHIDFEEVTMEEYVTNLLALKQIV